MIHEALHLHSPAYTKSEYSLTRGWGEGVVEQMQRLVRRDVLTEMGVTIGEDVFAERDDRHEYNGYIQALESLRLPLRMPALDFYGWLPATPLAQRPDAARAAGERLTEPERLPFRRLLLLAQARLGRQ